LLDTGGTGAEIREVRVEENLEVLVEKNRDVLVDQSHEVLMDKNLSGVRRSASARPGEQVLPGFCRQYFSALVHQYF